MRIEKRIIKGEEYTFICPDKVEYIKLEGYGYGQGTGHDFEIGIDGDVYLTGQKLNVAQWSGCCHLMKISKDRDDFHSDGEYYCDDPVLIAALARYLNTYNWPNGIDWPKIGFLLPLLSRKESQQYINWHLIPQPTLLW